jgi:SAM-dependent methyltransferase
VDLPALQRVWDRLGRDDPLWAVLTDARTKGGRWDAGAFFTTGVIEVDRILRRASEQNVEPDWTSALDFGCGVGRLTQALSRFFESTVGVDIAPSMIAEAERRNINGLPCRFVVNAQPDLRLFDDSSFDLVLSLLVLQHINPRYSKTYIGEFLRVLRPGGLAVFQIPSRRVGPSRRIAEHIALPPDAYRAELSCARSGLNAVGASQIAIRVTARNVTEHVWPPQVAGMALALGNHWYRADGSTIVHDDGRAYLTSEVPAGGSMTLDLTVSTPRKPGRYTLEVDMVHESVTWFAQRGSPTLRLPVDVGRPWRRRGKRVADEEGDGGSTAMEMHTVATSDVEKLVEARLGRVAWIDHRQTPGFDDCIYYVVKDR